jgi:hypothetical protein
MLYDRKHSATKNNKCSGSEPQEAWCEDELSGSKLPVMSKSEL